MKKLEAKYESVFLVLKYPDPFIYFLLWKGFL